MREKGQVTIPKPLWERFGIGPGAQVEFEEDGERLVLRKTGDGGRGRALVARLRGAGDKSLSADEILAMTRGIRRGSGPRSLPVDLICPRRGGPA